MNKTHKNMRLEKSHKQINKKIKSNKSIVIIAMLLLLFAFSGIVQARTTEIAENLIQEKEETINEIILKANEGITLTRTYKSGTESINLQWNSVSGATTYKVFQSKNGAGESLLTTVQGTSVTLNKANAGIKDEAAPSMPIVNASQDADGTGNNITITASTDNGTTYRHRIETTVVSDIQYVEGDMQEEAIKNGHDSITTRGTFIVPEGVTRIRVACVGGGGGDSSHSGGVDNGEDSFFGSVRATGGTASSLGTPNGLAYMGRRDGYGFAKSFTMTIVPSGYGSAYDNYYPHTSGSGGYISTYLDVTPGEEIAWQAGRGSHKGQGGYVLIAYGGEIQPETKYTSNTVSTTVTTGIKGYQYAITTNSVHTFTNEEIVSIADIPTYVSGEEQMVQYLHIRAVDNSGNVSATRSVLLQVPAKITLTSDYVYGENEVPLSWTINDKRAGYVYRLYQKEEGQETFTQIASSNSIEVIKYQETKTVKYTTPGTYTWTVPEGVTSITVTVAGAGGGAGGCVKYHYTIGDKSRDVYADVRGGNGGQGELIEKTKNVKEGEKYIINIGKAGTVGSREYLFEYTAASAYAGNGSNGQSSSFGSIIAKGRRRRNRRNSNRQ